LAGNKNSLKRVDLLYTESESGSYEFYSSYNCPHELKLSIKMAQELGEKWQGAGVDKTLQQAAERHFRQCNCTK